MDSITQPRTESLVWDQFRSLKTVSKTIGLDEDRQRRALRMSAERWAEWSVFLIDGPLPAWPKLLALLQTLGVAIHRIAVFAER
jgi:hypothetical protein